MKATQRAQRVGGPATQYLGHIDASGHCQVGPGARCWKAETQHLPRPHGKRSVRALLAAIEQRWHLRTAHSDQCVLLELQLRPHQRTLQARSAGRVAHQVIGCAQGVLVECAGRWDTQVVVTFAAQVLYRSGQPRFEYLDHASTSCNDLG